MARSQVQYGSQGSDVKELQKLLNQNGYSLDEDGIFGAKTQSAVKEYQKKMGLDVDGIVGVNTWSSFDKAKTTNAPKTDTGTGFKYKDFSYGDYKESDIVTQAKNALDAQLAQKPGEYKSPWQSQLDDTINKILNREKFSYDLNGDALYQQYKDKYIQQGKMAMQDTMGQASAMTGGYGNSYAQSVGQQAYNAQLENLNDIVPELYQMAYDRYNQEGQDLYNQYSMLGAQEEQDYGRYRDTVSDWNTERDYLTGRYDSERNYDYSKYSDERNFAYGTYSDDKSYAYNEHRNQIADEQWQKNFEEAKRQYDEQMAFQKQQYDDKKSLGSSGGSSSGGSSGGGSYSSGGSSGGGTNVSGGNNTGSGTNNSTGGGVSDTIRQKASTFTDNNALEAYLESQYNAGKISYEEMGELLVENEIPSLQNRNWTLKDDGGVNWFWGIDNNASVTDQYGNTYKLDKLVDALVAEGMTKSKAKEYVKELQSKLGA